MEKIDSENSDIPRLIAECIEKIKNTRDLKSAKALKKDLIIELIKRGIKIQSEDDEDDGSDSSGSSDD
ncbi:MAG: hypothetical protein IPL26_15865 [Leptospiraceae bacterium]|nr:hypothetical protein [Leptospiraceae bacterium]